MRAVIYTRVSQDKNDGRSVEDQERECRQWCDRQGWDVARVLTDNDIGASRFSGKERPAYAELKQILRPGDVLVTWEASRAQRDLSAYVELRDLCANVGVKWAYTGKVFDLSDGDDRFSTGLDALLAEKEAEQIRSRVLRGKRSAALDGRPAGKVLPGYRVIRDERTGRTVTWEPSELAPVMREVARRVLEGESLREVTRWANDSGLPGTRMHMRGRLMNPAYAGLRTHLGEVVGPARWPGLWSVELHEQLVAFMSDPARRNDGAGMPVKHLLSGIAKCGVCGAGLRHYWPPAAQKLCAPAAYICPQRTHVRRQQEPLERMVRDAVLAQLRSVDPAVLVDGDDVDARAARVEAETLRARLDAFIAEAADPDGLSPRALAVVEKKLTGQIAEAEARARPARRSPLIRRLVESPEDWERLLVKDRREVIRELVTVTVNPTTSRGVGEFRPEDVIVTPIV